MKNSQLTRALYASLLTFFLSITPLYAQSFTGIGDLPGGEYYSYANAISADGKVVVGASKSTATASNQFNTVAIRWTETGGLVVLGDLPGGAYNSNAFGVSANGSVIVGESASTNSSSNAAWNEAFRWTQSGGMQALGDLSGGNFGSLAWNISADGNVIVGQGVSHNGYEAFRWTSSGGLVALGDLSGGTFSSCALDASGNGSVIVGYGTSGHNTPPYYSTEGFKWTQAGGMVALGDLAGGLYHSTAYAISDDATVIVGSSINGPGPFYQAIYWKNGTKHLIPNLTGAQSSDALAVSGNGSVIVGQSYHGSSVQKVWIWKQSTGTKELKNVLVNDYGLNLTGWELTIPTGISHDGLTIVGTGSNPSGKTEGWVAKLSGSPSQQKIFVDVPNGGESWEATHPQPIVWHTQNFTGNVKIELSTNGGSSWTTIANNVSTPAANTATSYMWTVSNTPSTQCKVRISDATDGDPFDVSDANFTITSNSAITVDVPNGGENWVAGTPQPIVWHSHIYTGNVKIELSTNNGSSWTTIANSVSTPAANTATSYMWTVTNTPSTNCLVKISDAATGSPSDVSNNTFTIDPPGTNNTPVGTNVAINLSSDVTVTFDNVTGAGTTTLNKKNVGSPPPGGFSIIPASSPQYYDINTTATFTGNVTVCIQYDDTGLTTAQEQALTLQVYESPPGSWSDITTTIDINTNIICGELNHLSDFAIMVPTGGGTESITVISPNGGEDWQAGSEQEIIWTSSDFTGQIRIEVSMNGGTTYDEIVASTDDDGFYTYSVSNDESNTCLVKISDAADGDPFDTSDSYFSISSEPAGEDIFVTNTNDTGEGSLRNAISQANSTPGLNFILFQIPDTDPGYDGSRGVWTIKPQSAFPTISNDPVVLDGFSQSLFIGEERNQSGPEIEINGMDAGDGVDGLTVIAPDVTIIGLIINNFSRAGIHVSNSENGRISGCYIGTDYAGLEAAPNLDGILLQDSRGFHISPEDTLPNIISGNRGTAIYLNNSTHNFILGNLIGLKSSLTDTLGNLNGINLQDNADSNEVIENRICGNNGNGVYIFGSNANMIAHNFIGRHEDPEIQLGNTTEGVYITEISEHNMVFENMIGHNGNNGVFVFGSQALRNTISQNSITNNGSYGIENRNGGNTELSPPVITNVTSSSVSGTAPANSHVEIFFDADDEGELFIGEVQADAAGNFSWSGEDVPSELYVTATATDAEGNTSQFSDPANYLTDISHETNIQNPEIFSLSQNYPNPFNPETEIHFQIAEPSHVLIKIYTILGNEICTLVNSKYEPGAFNVTWNGKDAFGNDVSSGIYLCKLKAKDITLTKKMTLIR